MRKRFELLLAALVAVVIVGALPDVAVAHTGFESSAPADGDVVADPVAVLVIRFTGEAAPVGDGFVAREPTGTLRLPAAVTTADDKEFVLEFDPPLAGGLIGVRWEVQAQDAHPISGSFSFTVSTLAATTTLVDSSAPSTVPSTTPPGTSPATSTVSSPAGATSSIPETSQPLPPEAADAGTGGMSMEEFLAGDPSDAGSSRRLWGSAFGLLGVVGALGGIAFLASTLRGDTREITMGLRIVAGLGVVVAVAAGAEYWGTIVQAGASASAAWTSTPGVAMALRFTGGLAVAVGAFVAASRVTVRRPRRSLSAAVFDRAEAKPATVPLRRWRPTGAPLVLAGAGLLVASFWFDGHTVSRGPRIVHLGANSVHVTAGAVWVGGVVALALTVWSRYRRQLPARAEELIVRFSSIASISLVAVGLAGVLMAVFVLDSPGDLVSTEWGNTLLLKTSAVALAALGGAYNHFRLRPGLEADPDDPGLEAEFRYTLVAEAIILGFVVVVTAWLVAAATS